ncbi:MFS transporter [Arthrobacter globiformis]|uniref:MFS transporter n=1 Tax=Arthrobacter globiformis TaxID=1665 RepID=UPI000B40B2DD|nr:MFS transporter [Arthrobacter globiformis]
MNSPSTTAAVLSAPPAGSGRARAAVALLFLTNGALFANLLPRYPAIMEELRLSNAEFGLAVAAFPLGALIAGLASGALIRRFRSSRVAVAGTILTSLGILGAGTAPSWAVLAAALFFAGAMDAVTDVAQNAHGLRVQRLYQRSIINSLHAVWSIGAVLGGLMGAAAAGLNLAPGIHLSISAALFAALTLCCYRFLLRGPETDDDGAAAAAADGQPALDAPKAARGTAAKYGILAALVLIATAGALVEDAGSSWSAIYLSDTLEAATTVAGLGFVALTGAQFVGRLLGDRLVDRFGQRTVARAGGIIAAVGMGTALLVPSIPGTILGFAAAGLGVATLVPAAMHAADELPGLRPGTGLTMVSWLMRVGFLVSPPVVGAIADAVSLRAGLVVVPLAGLLVLALSPVLAKRTAS